MSSDLARRAGTAGLLTLAVLLGLALRLAPLAGDAGGDFTSDQAFHLRMIREVAEQGRVPALDRLSDPPLGRPVGRLLPVGLYHAAAAFHALLAWAGASSLRAAALGFTALAGALIALPAFLLALALLGDRRAALIAAFAAVVLPAHLHRTFCWWLRYDGLGTLLALAHLAFLVRALAADGARRVVIEAAVAGLLLALTVACWRVPLVLPSIEAAALLLLLLTRGVERRAALAFVVCLGLAALTCLPIGYVRAQGLLLSPAWLVPLALAAGALAPWMRPGGRRLPRAATAGLALATAWIAGGLLGRAGAYGDLMQILPARLVALAGGQPRVTPIAALLLNVEELGVVRPVELFGPGNLSWLGAWCAGALLLRRSAAGQPDAARTAPTTASTLFGLTCAALTAATLLFARDKVLLAPLVAVLTGGLASWTLGSPGGRADIRGARATAAPDPARRARRAGRSAPRAATSWPRIARRAALATLVLCAAMTLYQATTLALTRRSRPDPDLAAALGWLRGRTPVGAVVASPWQQGYDIQSFAGRASVMDGMLEAPGNQERIVEFARAAMERGPDSLAAFCRRQRAGWLLVPPSPQLLSIALVAGMPFVSKLGPGIPLDREEGDRVLIRMMVLGESPPPFQLAFERGGYRVYRLVPAGAATPAPG